MLLTFITQGNQITATMPANANIAPPGFYMLFLVGPACPAQVDSALLAAVGRLPEQAGSP